ncbi:MAG TPA: glycosyltransferase [Ktedonobacterales bacterium]|nr:glycosyltransferase [Ktedonobacterales bacterium]
MLYTVDVGKRSLRAYRGIVPDETLEELREAAAPLRNLRVLHLNATPYGGGVSELLRSVVPLLNDLGLRAKWQVISGGERFFHATKAIHNGLQGSARRITPDETAAYELTSRENAARLEVGGDIVVVHDPQPVALLSMRGKGDARWIWRCHIDTSAPNPQVWDFMRGYLSGYDVAVFTMPEFVPPDLPIARVEVIPPAIDPLSPKNLPLAERTARQIITWIGVELDSPLVTQVARFDPWKDPLGVIAAYRLVRQWIPNLQLALVGSMALDDPEGWDIYNQLVDMSQKDPLVHVFSNYTGVGNIEVNAFQRLSDVIIQKSVREGFGLVVSEALWKGTPVVAGRAGGIPLQMADGAGGLLVESPEECAEAVLKLMRDREGAAEMAKRGQDRVRERFLLPRLLLDELRLMAATAAGTARP